MSSVNNGIVNSGSIGGNATVTITDYGTGNVISTNSAVDVRQRAERTARALEEQQKHQAPDLAALTTALVQLSRQVATIAESRAEDVSRILTAIDALAKELAAGRQGGAEAKTIGTRILEAVQKIANVAPDAVKLAKQVAALAAF